MSTTISRENPMQALRALVRLLDEAVTIPGTKFRFGLDALMGLIPGAGDIAGAAMTGFTILTAFRMGAPGSVLFLMVLNLGIDAIVGAVPLLGDLFDFGFKANRRNLDLLEQHVQNPQYARRSSRIVLFAVLALLALVIVGIAWLLVSVIQVLMSVKL